MAAFSGKGGDTGRTTVDGVQLVSCRGHQAERGGFLLARLTALALGCVHWEDGAPLVLICTKAWESQSSCQPVRATSFQRALFPN